MKDHPLIFQPDMVRALWLNNKVRTRRLLTKRNTTFDGAPWPTGVELTYRRAADSWIDPSFPDSPILKVPMNGGAEATIHRIRPRIETGDRIWVRENCRAVKLFEGNLGVEYLANEPLGRAGRSGHFIRIANTANSSHEWGKLFGYRKGPKNDRVGKTVPSIHTPKWASRFTLPVHGVRIQRLQDITEKEAIEEGITASSVLVDSVFVGDRYRDTFETRYFCENGHKDGYDSAYEAFEALICGINGREVWASNPWVIEYEFVVQHGNVDRVVK